MFAVLCQVLFDKMPDNENQEKGENKDVETTDTKDEVSGRVL